MKYVIKKAEKNNNNISNVAAAVTMTIMTVSVDDTAHRFLVLCLNYACACAPKEEKDRFIRHETNTWFISFAVCDILKTIINFAFIYMIATFYLPPHQVIVYAIFVFRLNVFSSSSRFFYLVCVFFSPVHRRRCIAHLDTRNPLNKRFSYQFFQVLNKLLLCKFTLTCM